MTTECTFNEQVYLSLSEENQIKVEHIYGIAATLHQYRQPRLTAKEFDDLYDKSISDLEALSGLFRLRVQASIYGEMLQDMNRKRNIQEDDGN